MPLPKRVSVNGPRHHAIHAAVLSALMMGGGAYAQQAAPPQAAGDEEKLEEIVVTAQKREQLLQDVPIAVTAIDSGTIEANRVVSIMDLTGLAPGLVARANAGALGSPSYTMRGVFASASQPSSDRQISTYIDGVYLGSSRAGVFDLPDTDRIEVLRGPQGTLFGRNATAGAVSVVTRDPSGKFGLRQDVTVGNLDQIRSRTTFDTPQFGPFSAYLTYVYDERRGDTRNLGAGTTFDRTSPYTNIGVTRSPEWLGGHKNNDVFAALKFEPFDSFTAVYKLDYSHSDFTPEARATVAINAADPNLVGGLLTQLVAAQPAGGGAFGPVTIDPSNLRPGGVNNAWTMQGYQVVYGHNLTMKWQATDSLSFKNIAAYRHSEVYGPSAIMGLDGLQFTAGSVTPYATFAAISALGAGFFSLTPAQQAATIGGIAGLLKPAVGLYFAGYEGNSFGRAWQVSDEQQANYDSKFLTLTVGGLYYHSYELSSGLPGMAANFAFQPLPPQLPLGNVAESTSATISYAGYAQGEIHVLPKLDVVLGARITDDKKQGALNVGGVYSGTRTSGSISGETDIPWTFNSTKPSYSAGVNYKPIDNVLLYAKYSTAFMSGGAVGSLSFQPETVESPEVGIKSEWLDHRLRANLALYSATYYHTQSSQSGLNVGLPELSVVVIDNGTLSAKGFEFEGSALLTRGLTFGGSIGYTDAYLEDPNPIVTAGHSFALSGVPKWVGNLNGQYESMPVLGDAFLSFRIDGNYQGKYRAIPYTDLATTLPAFLPYEFTDARWIVNTRLALKDFKLSGADAEVALWARNLFNNKAALDELQFGTIEVDSSFELARTFGADLSVRF
jgi:iron complex outermembrane recepter protein